MRGREGGLDLGTSKRIRLRGMVGEGEREEEREKGREEEQGRDGEWKEQRYGAEGARDLGRAGG